MTVTCHGYIVELNQQLARSKSDLAAEKLSREDLECKLRLVTKHRCVVVL